MAELRGPVLWAPRRSLAAAPSGEGLSLHHPRAAPGAAVAAVTSGSSGLFQYLLFL